MNIGKSHLTQIQFEKLWLSIHHELTLLYNNKKCSASLIYNNIYIKCTSTSHKYVEDLYWKIGDFLYEILRNHKSNIFDSNNFIQEYITLYKNYSSFVYSVNDVADYLNQYITSKSIYQFAFLLWERCILQACPKYKNITLGEYLVSHPNKNEVRSCKESFRNILVDPSNPLLYYVERYEKYALSSVIDRCVLNEKDILEYCTKVSILIKNELSLASYTFLEESLPKLKEVLENILINNKKKWIKSEIYKILSNHILPVEILNTIRNSMNIELIKIDHQYLSNDLLNSSDLNSNDLNDFTSNDLNSNDLNDFYALFSSKVPTLYTFNTSELKLVGTLSALLKNDNILSSVLKKYITNQLNYYNHLLDKKIETLYIFYTLFKHVVKVGFHNTPDALSILHVVLGQVYNNLSPSLGTRLIQFTNVLIKGECVLESKKVELRKGFVKNEVIDLNEEEGKDYWNDITIEELDNDMNEDMNDDMNDEDIKDDSASISSTSISSSSSVQKINNLNFGVKSVPDLTKINISYKDKALLRVFITLYNLVDDKTDFFKKYLSEVGKRVLLNDINYYKELEIFNLLKCEDRDLRIKGEIMFSDMKSLMTSGIHYLTESAWNLSVSHCDLIIPNINIESKRNIKWAWEYSICVIEINNKEYRVNMLQYTVLNLYNHYDKLDMELIKEKTGLKKGLLENTINSLIKSKIINSHLSLINSDIVNIADYFIKEDIEEKHEINKEMYYLCKLAKIMKKFKKLHKSELIKMMDLEDIEGYIKSGVEKGILEETNEHIIYMP